LYKKSIEKKEALKEEVFKYLRGLPFLILRDQPRAKVNIDKSMARRKSKRSLRNRLKRLRRAAKKVPLL
jgi:hypothetical protein